MESKKAKTGLVLNTLVNSLMIIVTLVVIVLFNLSVIQKANLEQSEAGLRDDYDVLIKSQVESVISILEHYHTRVLTGELTMEEAKKEAAGVVRGLRYGDEGYFWVDTSRGVNVVLLGWDTEGTNRLEAVDSYGYTYVRSFLSEGLQHGGGFTDYHFPLPDDPGSSYPKRGYTKYFAPFDWVVGTGNYVDSIEHKLAEFANRMNSRSFTTILSMAGATLVLLVISMITTTRLSTKRSRSEEKRLEDLVARRTSELDRQRELMALVNDTAALLMASDVVDYTGVMMRCMEMIGKSIDVDRVSIWKNKRKDDGRLYYRLICQWANEGLPELDKETDFAYEEVMPSWEGIFTRGETINCTIDELPEPEHSELVVFGLESLLAIPIFLHGELWGFVSYDDYHNRRAFGEGEVFVLRSWGLLAVGAIQRDEIALSMRSTLTKLEAVTSNYKGIIWSVDADGVITTYNGRFLQKIGVVPSSVEGKKLDRAREDNKYLDIAGYVHNTYVEGAQDWTSDIDDGVYEYHATLMHDGEGVAIGVVGSTDDVTERVLLQRDLETAVEEAEAANRAKSVFLANMSHEIRTPMNAILGITDIQMLDETLDPRIREAFGKIYNSGDLLLGIINDILDLSKIEAGKLELTTARYEIASLISDTAQLNIMRIGSKPIEFLVEVDPDTPSTLMGDELRVKQILNNLLSNAFKYTAEGTVKLYITAEVAESGEEAAGGAGSGSDVVIVVSVSDTGQGMTQEQVSQLFDEYARFNMEANKTTEGTGLGMSITRNLVRMMGGEIGVDSEPGKGSVFTVRIRQVRIGDDVLGKEVAENLEQFREDSGAQMRRVQITRDPMPYGSVLIVDDVETNIYVAAGLLAPYGLKVDSAGSGFEAIDKIKEGNTYDIIFMDHMMPKMDGMEATGIIRGMDYTRSIVALTADAVVGQSEMFLANGFDDFISKPIDIRQLNTVLNKLIRDKQPPEVVEEARRQHALAGQEQASGEGAQAGSAPAASTRGTAPQAAGGDTAASQQPAISQRFADAFVRDAVKSLAALEDIQLRRGAYEEDDVRTYIIHVHGMKSALANIGEKELSSIALKLEMAGRDHEVNVMDTETTAFIDSLRLVVEKLSPKKEGALDAISDEDMAYLHGQLIEVRAAFAAYNKKSARELLAGLREKAWPQAVLDELEAISVHLLHSDFEEGVKAVDSFSI
ncbi:MAG: cache domain-containing protein [Clostridiales bacterium]|nr:cache domain-containing protein [Clostridiales bacterium]